MQRIECPIAQPGEWILPNGQAKFLGNWNYRGTVINPACQNIVFFGGGGGGGASSNNSWASTCQL